MPYILRNEQGEIVALTARPTGNRTEFANMSRPEVLAFLMINEQELSRVKHNSFLHSDLSFIRVLDDVIELLVEKHVFEVEELPEIAKRKIKERREFREKIRSRSKNS